MNDEWIKTDKTTYEHPYCGAIIQRVRNEKPIFLWYDRHGRYRYTFHDLANARRCARKFSGVAPYPRV